MKCKNLLQDLIIDYFEKKFDKDTLNQQVTIRVVHMDRQTNELTGRQTIMFHNT